MERPLEFEPLGPTLYNCHTSIWPPIGDAFPCTVTTRMFLKITKNVPISHKYSNLFKYIFHLIWCILYYDAGYGKDMP